MSHRYLLEVIALFQRRSLEVVLVTKVTNTCADIVCVMVTAQALGVNMTRGFTYLRVPDHGLEWLFTSLEHVKVGHRHPISTAELTLYSNCFR